MVILKYKLVCWVTRSGLSAQNLCRLRHRFFKISAFLLLNRL